MTTDFAARRRAARPERPTLADVVAEEHSRVRAGTSPGCGASCACHGDVVCVRTEHPHDPDVDMGPGKPRGNVVPHAGYDTDGQLVQWVHTSEHGPVRSAEQVAESRVQARREHTRGLLDGLDMDVFAEALAGPLARALAEHRRDGGTA